MKLPPQPHPHEAVPAVLRSHIVEMRHELSKAYLALGIERPLYRLGSKDPEALHNHISIVNEELADAYLALSGMPSEAHTTDCTIKQGTRISPWSLHLWCGARCVTILMPLCQRSRR